MGLHSWRYLGLFLPGVWLALWAAPPKRRRAVLLGASLLFYALACRWLLLELLLFALAAYAGGRGLTALDGAAPAVRQRRKKGVMALAVGFLLWRLWCCKAAPALPGWAALLGKGALGGPGMPLGILFYGLMALGYLTEVYRGEAAAAESPGRVLLFLGFFAQVTEGPIGRWRLLGPQLEQPRPAGPEEAAPALARMLWGLCKKVVVADRANMLVGRVFDDWTGYSGRAVVLAAVLYTLQLYAEFSGSMDLVLGSARLVGVTLEENFRQPFFARSIPDFWRRWHITLGRWLKECVLQPFVLGPAGRRLARVARPLGRLGRMLPAWAGAALVWLAMGLWHGVAWKYLAYGGYYCALQLLGELWRLGAGPRWKRFAESGPWQAVCWVRTLLLVQLGMLLFRANGLRAFWAMVCSLGRPWAGSVLELGLDGKDLGVLAVGAAVMLLADLAKERGLEPGRAVLALPLPLRWGVWLTGCAVLAVFGAYGLGYDPADLIYAQF